MLNWFAVRRMGTQLAVAAAAALSACGGGDTVMTDRTAAFQTVAPRAQAISRSDQMIHSFAIDGYSRIRISDMTRVGALIDRAIAANANTICFTYNLPFDTTGHVLDSALMWGIEETALRPADLVPAIRLARSKGLAVMIKPQTTIYDASGPTDQGNIVTFFISRYPSFSINRFFSDYQERLSAFAEMAQAEGVAVFSVGTENDGLNGPDRDAQWRSVISAVRSRFAGLLTYGASVRFYQTDARATDFRAVTFWDALDMVGLSLYPGWGTLPGKFADYEPMSLFSHVQWNAATPVFDLKAMIDPVLKTNGKKLFIEEFAFQATPDQLQTGYDVSFYGMAADKIGPPDYANQAKGYEYYLQYFLTAFDGKLIGFNPWVLNGAPWILSNSEVPKWRISQWLVIGETDGSLFSKPSLETIGQFYGGSRWNDIVVHRPTTDNVAVSGGPFRDVVFRPSVANPNTSNATSLFVDGGSNVNTVVLPGLRSDYTIRREPDSILAWRTSGGASQFPDKFTSVQRMRFSDISLAFDLDGEAGSVAKILAVVFGPSAVKNQQYAGIGMSILAGGANERDLMRVALNARLGTGFGHGALVDLLFSNLAGRQPSSDERNIFVDLLNSGVIDQIGLALLAMNTPVNALNADIAGLSMTGLAFFEVSR